jgi:hypothetical protein
MPARVVVAVVALLAVLPGAAEAQSAEPSRLEAGPVAAGPQTRRGDEVKPRPADGSTPRQWAGHAGGGAAVRRLRRAGAGV